LVSIYYWKWKNGYEIPVTGIKFWSEYLNGPKYIDNSQFQIINTIIFAGLKA
jgi:hypothetical protein